MSEARQKAKKRFYVTPTLTTYGDVSKITEGPGGNGKNDSGNLPGKTAV